MNEEQIIELKNKILTYLHKLEHKGAILEKIYKDLNLRPFPITALRSYLDEIYIKGYISKNSISGSRTIYKITEKGRYFAMNGGYGGKIFTKNNQEDSTLEDKQGKLNVKKKLLFISYANENYDKVKLIKKELERHFLFEPLIVADRRKPNKALVKLVTDGIDSSFCVIPIISSQSYKTQWINQEIGYAYCKEINIIPIIENSVLDELKGIIHKQNQCPYLYTGRLSLTVRDENKSFMTQFRTLIKDIEELLSETEETKLEQNVAPVIIRESSGPESRYKGIIELRKPLGIIARSGETCPERGVWKTTNQPTTTLELLAGLKMPAIQGKPVIWKLVSYT